MSTQIPHLKTRFSYEETGSGSISVSNEPIRSVPSAALNIRNNGGSSSIDDFTAKLATEYAVDTHPHAKGQFSRVGNRSRGKIPARVRLVPLRTDQRIQQVQGLQQVQQLHADGHERHSTYRVGLGYGRQVYRLRWFIIVLWAVALLVSLPFSSKLSSVLKSGGLIYSSSDSAHVSDIATNKLHMPPLTSVGRLSLRTDPGKRSRVSKGDE
jgi:hypothetical protein